MIRIPSIEGVENIPYLDNVSVLALTQRPEHLIVVGGSYIGLEMSQIFRRLGSDVTIVNIDARLAAREDEDVSESIQGVLEREGIRVINDAALSSVEKSAEEVALILKDGKHFVGSHFVSIFSAPQKSLCSTPFTTFRIRNPTPPLQAISEWKAVAGFMA